MSAFIVWLVHSSSLENLKIAYLGALIDVLTRSAPKTYVCQIGKDLNYFYLSKNSDCYLASMFFPKVEQCLKADISSIVNHVMENRTKDPFTIRCVLKSNCNAFSILDRNKQHIMNEANEKLKNHRLQVTALQVMNNKYSGGDMTNTLDGNVVGYMAVGVCTLGLGFYLYPVLYNGFRRVFPSVHYHYAFALYD